MNAAHPQNLQPSNLRARFKSIPHNMLIASNKTSLVASDNQVVTYEYLHYIARDSNSLTVKSKANACSLINNFD